MWYVLKVLDEIFRIVVTATSNLFLKMIILDATTKVATYLIHRFQEQRSLLLKEI